jgi:hypothetical protein
MACDDVKTQRRVKIQRRDAKHGDAEATGLCGLKGALALMGRDCGPARSPNTALTAQARETLAAALKALPAMAAEPCGW